MAVAFVFFMKKYPNNHKLNIQPKLLNKNGLIISIATSILITITFIIINLFLNRQIIPFDPLVLIGTILFVTTQELFWRGTLQKLFQCKINPKAAIAITTTLFTLSQTSSILFTNAPGNILFALIEGLILGTIIQKTNKTEIVITTRIITILIIYLII